MSDFVLSKAELHAITGYKLASAQLEALHRSGFYRARLGPTGSVILERAHYDAVCAGVQQPQRPKINPPRDAKRPHAPRLAAQGL
jgi:hypothetical protein